MQLSVVVPVYNEEAGLEEFLNRISNALSKLEITYEIILVDDGSKDQTVGKIRNWSQLNQSVQVVLVEHLINRGHTVSLNSGLQQAQGQFILSMDGDLQHPPELVGEFWLERDSADVVVGCQESRSSSVYKVPLAFLFYRFVGIISGIPIVRNNGDFRLMRRDLLEAASNSNLFWKPIRFLIPKYQLTTKSIKFSAAERFDGKSKYDFYSLLRFGFNSLLYSTNRPLLFSVALSSLFAISSLIQIGFLFFWYFQGISIPGWTTIVLILTIGFAGISFSLAVISLYLVKVLESISYGSKKFGSKVEFFNKENTID